ncbi:hypothetical protein OROHE_021361 [Orobanche hederae]
MCLSPPKLSGINSLEKKVIWVRSKSELIPSFNLRRCEKISHGDWISRMPDDILISILSLLPLEDAAKTSILSSRWTNLWKHTPSLDFDVAHDALLCKIINQKALREQKRCEYANWVNCILQKHKAPTLRNFRIKFDLKKPSHKAITQWLEFEKVQNLVLDLSLYVHFGTCSDQHYAFPKEFLFGGGPSAFQNNMLVDIKLLKILSLKSVNVSGEAIEFVLHNCPLLEELVVHGSYELSNLEVCGSSLVLKQLEICNNFNLKSIKVSAPHLTSLGFTIGRGKSNILLLENVPMLIEVSILCSSYEILLPSFSRCISQVQVLNLNLLDPKDSIELRNFPEMSKLRMLVIEYAAWNNQSLIGVTTLIRASPYLEGFVLNVGFLPYWQLCSDPSWSDRHVKNTIKFVHRHLKVIKVCGYYDRTSDELVKSRLRKLLSIHILYQVLMQH